MFVPCVHVGVEQRSRGHAARAAPGHQAAVRLARGPPGRRRHLRRLLRGRCCIVFVFLLPGGLHRRHAQAARPRRSRSSRTRRGSADVEPASAPRRDRRHRTSRRRRRATPRPSARHIITLNEPGGDSMGSTRRLHARSRVRAALVLAAACGDDDDDAGDTPSASDAPAATEGGAAPTTPAEPTRRPAAPTTTEAATDETTGGGDDHRGRHRRDDRRRRRRRATTASARRRPAATAVRSEPDDETSTSAPATSSSTQPSAPRTGTHCRASPTTRSSSSSACPSPGPLAGFGLIADGMQQLLRLHQRDDGGIDGRQITLDVKDDDYEPDKTKTNVDEALGRGEYAAFVTVLGTPNNLGRLGRPQRRVHAAAAQRHRRRRSGVTSRTTRGPRACSSTTSPRPACGPSGSKTSTRTAPRSPRITFNNDFGKSYSNGFASAIEGTNIEVVDPGVPRADGART